MKTQTRIAQWDNVRFFMILFVVVGHFTEQIIAKHDTMIYRSIFLFIYSVHMPLFFYLAGCFHKNTNISYKCISYILAGYVCKMCLIFCRAVLVSGFSSISFSLFTESGLPWFMFVMAAFTALTYLLKNRNSWFILFFSVLLGMFVGYDHSIGDFLVLSRIVVFFPFYWMGYMFKEKPLETLSQKRVFKVFSILILAAWICICFISCPTAYLLRPFFTGRNAFPEQFSVIGPLIRLVAYSISTIVGSAIIVMTPRQKLPLVTLGGSRTMQIYFWHYIAIYALLPLQNTLIHTTIGRLIWLFIGVLVPFILIWKPLRYPLSLCFQQPKVINK